MTKKFRGYHKVPQRGEGSNGRNFVFERNALDGICGVEGKAARTLERIWQEHGRPRDPGKARGSRISFFWTKYPNVIYCEERGQFAFTWPMFRLLEQTKHDHVELTFKIDQFSAALTHAIRGSDVIAPVQSNTGIYKLPLFYGPFGHGLTRTVLKHILSPNSCPRLRYLGTH